MSCKENLKEAFNKSKDEPKCFDVDVVFLTLILQSVGFRLDNFEFAGKTDGITSNDLKVKMKCEKTGLTSNMSFDTSNCTCPEQKQNSAFWEVQGSDPNTPRKKDTIIEKSSSFIPEISKNCSNILKNCMTDLTNFLDNEVNNLNKSTSDLSNVKQFVEKLNSDNLLSKIQDCARLTDFQQSLKNIKIEKTPEERSSTTLFVTPFTTPLSSINITPVNAPTIAPKILINNSNKCSTPPAEGFDNSTSPFNLIDKTSNLITSSPNRDQSRDANIMQAIIDAKQKLDNALIYLKFNCSPTVDSTSFTMTPRNEVLGRKSDIMKVPSSISRRQSTGSSLNSRTSLGSVKKAMPPPLSLPKRDAKQLTSKNLSLLSRSKPDTPRPGEINKTNRLLGLVRKPIEKSVSSGTVRPSPLSKSTLSKSYSKLPTKK